jgi:hypothetical protein
MTGVNEGPRSYQFDKYTRAVLPIDGFAFWVKTGTSIKVQGSLHYATELEQRQDETTAVNRVVFNTNQEVQEFNDVGPTTIYVGRFEDIRFAFSSRENWFRQAGIYHYLGSAVYSDMTTQLLDNISQLPVDAVVSNSLPIWLGLNGGSTMPFPQGFAPLPLFPSFLVPANFAPPFASVHVADTLALQAAPYLDSQFDHSQLVRDRVQVTTYGARNDQVIDFIDYVNQFTLDTDDMGVMSMAVVMDDKRAQPELAILAQKKTIDWEVSYYQQRARDAARQLITQATSTLRINPVAPPFILDVSLLDGPDVLE